MYEVIIIFGDILVDVDYSH